MYTNTRFQAIGTTSDFGTKFGQNYVNDKIFEKLNIKIVISIQQCTSLSNFSQSGNLQFLGPDLPRKHFREEY